MPPVAIPFDRTGGAAALGSLVLRELAKMP